MPDNFTWNKTPQKVKEYFVELLGAVEAKKLMLAMRRRDWIIVDGPHGPTGKTTLVDILTAIGYTRVIEAYCTTTIQVSEALTDLREKNEIFEALGISGKC